MNDRHLVAGPLGQVISATITFVEIFTRTVTLQVAAVVDTLSEIPCELPGFALSIIGSHLSSVKR